MRHEQYTNRNPANFRRDAGRRTSNDRSSPRRSERSYSRRSSRSPRKYSKSPPAKHTKMASRYSRSPLSRRRRMSPRQRTRSPRQRTRSPPNRRSLRGTFKRSSKERKSVEDSTLPRKSTRLPSASTDTTSFFPPNLQRSDYASSHQINSLKQEIKKNLKCPVNKSSAKELSKPLNKTSLSFGLKLLANNPDTSQQEVVQISPKDVHKQDKSSNIHLLQQRNTRPTELQKHVIIHSENEFSSKIKMNLTKKSSLEEKIKPEILFSKKTPASLHHHQPTYRSNVADEREQDLQKRRAPFLMPTRKTKFSPAFEPIGDHDIKSSHFERVEETSVKGYYKHSLHDDDDDDDVVLPDTYDSQHQSGEKQINKQWDNFELSSSIVSSSKDEEAHVSYSWVGEYLDDDDDTPERSKQTSASQIDPNVNRSSVFEKSQEKSRFHPSFTKYDEPALSRQGRGDDLPIQFDNDYKHEGGNDQYTLLQQRNTRPVQELLNFHSSDELKPKISQKDYVSLERRKQISEKHSSRMTGLKNVSQFSMESDDNFRNRPMHDEQQYGSRNLSKHDFSWSKNVHDMPVQSPSTQHDRYEENLYQDKKPTNNLYGTKQGVATVDNDFYDIKKLHKIKEQAENKTSPDNKYSYSRPYSSSIQSSQCNSDNDKQQFDVGKYDHSQNQSYAQTLSSSGFPRRKFVVEEDNERNASFIDRKETFYGELQKTFPSSSQLFPRKANYYEYDSISEHDMDIESGDDNLNDVPLSSATNTSRVVQKKEAQSISDFQGKWKALTNTSIKVSEQDPDHYQPRSSQLGSRLHELPSPTHLYQRHNPAGDKRISVIRKPMVSDNPVDKREVQYSSRDTTLNKFSEGKRLTIDQHSFNIPQQSSNKEFMKLHHENFEEIASPGGPDFAEDKDDWERHFVDWFSQHILPTPPFKYFLKKTYPKLTSSHLASMPLDFLWHFQSGDQHARNCLPKSHLEADTLFAFLRKYRKSTSEAMSDKPDMKVVEKSVSENYEDEAQPAVPSKDVTIPVLISRSNLPSFNEIKRHVTPLASSSNTSPKMPMGNLVITCSNAMTQSNDTRNLRKISTQTAAATSSHSAKPHLPLQLVTTLTSTKQLHPQSHDSTLRAVQPSDHVNPRWNAEVQQFIGRTQSANRKPIYLEYLEKTSGSTSTKEFSKEAPKKQSRFSRRSSSPISRRKDSSENDGRSRQNQNNRKSKRSRSPSLSNSSSSTKVNPKKIRKNGNSSERMNEKSKETGSSSGEKQKVTASPTKSTSSTKDDDKAKPGSSATKLSRDVSSDRKHDGKKSASEEKKVSSENRISYEKDPEVLFAMNKKKTMAMEDIVFDDADMKSCSVQFKCDLKNEAKQLINFHYAFENYDHKKIKDVIRKVYQKSKEKPVCSMQQAISYLKSLFKECAKNSFQESLKKKLNAKGKDWKVTSWNTFEIFKRPQLSTAVAAKVYFEILRDHMRNLKDRFGPSKRLKKTLIITNERSCQDEVFKCCDGKLDKKMKFSQQKKQSLYDIVDECELLFPQYSGDSLNLIKLWLWKIQATCFEFLPRSDTSKEIRASWRARSDKKDFKSWFSTVFRHPPFNSTIRRSSDVFSVLHVEERWTKRECVDNICSWWLDGYYQWRYSEFKDCSNPSELPGDMMIVDEDGCYERGDSTDPGSTDMFADIDDLEDASMKEYAEDDSGAPTILLY